MTLFRQDKQHLKLPNAEIEYYPNFLSAEKADTYFELILRETNWQQDNIKVFGKTYKQPRLTALYGESNQPYSYSNIIMHPMPFTKTVMAIKKDIEAICGEKFNTVLINLYRDGNDSNGWHGDNEKELGVNPVIASLSLGEVRPFHFKHRKLKKQRYKIELQHGSLLLMKGEMQHHWLHQIAKTKKKIDPRINLTFRRLLN